MFRKFVETRTVVAILVILTTRVWAAFPVTQIAELSGFSGEAGRFTATVDLKATVLTANPHSNQVALHDESGVAVVEINLQESPLEPGDVVSLRGGVICERGRLRAGPGPLVNNDGFHAELEATGGAYLSEGLHSFRLGYFNAAGKSKLSLEMEGPGIPRQAISRKMFFHTEAGNGGKAQNAPGLNYATYLGRWDSVPDFRGLAPARRGVTDGVGVSLRERDEFFGLNFTGWIEIPTAGRYDFFLTSDDGSRLWIGDGKMEARVIGKTELPAAKRLKRMPKNGFEWGSVEGIVTFQRADGGRLEMQLNTGSDAIRVEVANARGFTPELFSRVRVTGVVGAGEIISSSGAHVTTLKRARSGVQPLARTIGELRKKFGGKSPVRIPARLEGKILAESPDGSVVIFEDATGKTLIELPPTAGLSAGSQVRITGAMSFEDGRVKARSGRLVNNDGIHQAEEKSGAIFLRAGKRPIEAMYFNAFGEGIFEVSYSGPGIEKQVIPPSALFRLSVDPATGDADWLPGVDYGAYEGYWRVLPNPLDPILKASGVAEEISARVVTNEVTFALDFRGFIEIPSDGEYVFSVRSDDGSALYVGDEPLRVEVIGTAAAPEPATISVRQSMPKEAKALWAEVEGIVTFVEDLREGAVLEIASSSGHMRLEIASAPDFAPEILLNSRVRARGLCLPSYTADGQFLAAEMQTPGLKWVQILNLPNRLWADHPIREIGSISREDGLIHLSARVFETNGVVTADDGTGQILVEGADLTIEAPGQWVELLGRVGSRGNRLALSCAVSRALNEPENSLAMRLLTTVEEVKSLKRHEAERGYAAKLRGTVTALLPMGFFLQDSTRGIYVDWKPGPGEEQIRIGDYWEIEGTTTMDFAPNVTASKARRIGGGVLPEPLRPSWDQLNNGSLDTHYIEIEGIITQVADENVKLLTRLGRMSVAAYDIDPQILKDAENAKVRLRGCIAPDRDDKLKVIPGQIMLHTTSLSVDEPAAADVFKAPLKQISDFSLFDSGAGALQRVKVQGQILHAHDGEYFLFDGTNGMRFIAQNGRLDLQPRDRVEVVGFPHLIGAYPVLRDAVARKVGVGPWPRVRALSETNLLNARFDASLVEVEGLLVSARAHRGERLLEIQAGARTFNAYVPVKPAHDRHSSLAVGSRLRLTGVYAGERDTFELHVNSAEDVTVLERPDWWTLQHTVTLFGALSAVLLGAAVWIKSLQKRVEERTRALKEEIEIRQIAEERAQRARKEAEGANRAKSQFLAAMSHEIRTPMNGVLGMTNLLLETDLDGQQREFAETTRQSAESLLTIINDILDFSKIEAGKLNFEMVDFDLTETIESVFQLLSETARAKNLAFNFRITPEVPRYLNGDPGRLRQVLVNLLGNGIKFTPTGEVLLAVKLVAQRNGRATLAFTVKDTGIGIDEEGRNRLFHPFTQADSSTTRKFGGTGLGLVISKRLVEMMSGEIGVESRPGNGSNFSFTAIFDIAQEPKPAKVAVQDQKPAIQAGLRILLAEDNLINQRVAIHQLQQIGHVADAVANGHEVLDAIARQKYDVILMDCQMPEMDGLEATRKLREQGSNIWIIAMTANAMQGDRDTCIAAGMDDYVSKPVRAEKLIEALKHVREHEAGVSLGK